MRSVVSLVVSQGQKPVDVPDVVTLLVGDATATLQRQGLKLQVSQRMSYDNIAADVIASQSPIGGSQVDPGSTIAVVVSAGPPQLTLPDVGNQNVLDAQNQLQQLGLVAHYTYVVDARQAAGTVLKQDPAPTSQVSKGSSVTLSVAVPGVVPDVTGQTQDAARAALQAAGYTVGNVAYTQEGTEGTVVRTEPAAGSQLRPGESVNLYVSGVSP
jgi:serine/threonine-protein kinase